LTGSKCVTVYKCAPKQLICVYNIVLYNLQIQYIYLIIRDIRLSLFSNLFPLVHWFITDFIPLLLFQISCDLSCSQQQTKPFLTGCFLYCCRFFPVCSAKLAPTTTGILNSERPSCVLLVEQPYNAQFWPTIHQNYLFKAWLQYITGEVCNLGQTMSKNRCAHNVNNISAKHFP
jgi:hypothetical protein